MKTPLDPASLSHTDPSYPTQARTFVALVNAVCCLAEIAHRAEQDVLDPSQGVLPPARQSLGAVARLYAAHGPIPQLNALYAFLEHVPRREQLKLAQLMYAGRGDLDFSQSERRRLANLFPRDRQMGSLAQQMADKSPSLAKYLRAGLARAKAENVDLERWHSRH